MTLTQMTIVPKNNAWQQWCLLGYSY